MKAPVGNLKYGYGDGWFNPEEKRADTPLKCEFTRAGVPALSFRAESVRTAKLIAEQAYALGRTPVLLLSGGLDSHVALHAFLEAGVDFKTMTFRFVRGLNAHELHFVHELLARHSFAHQYYEMNPETWLKSAEAAELFQSSFSWHFEMVPHMKLMLDVAANGGFPVLGNGEALYKKIDGAWSYIEYEYDLAWYRFARKFNVHGAMGFFQHTPEMTLAMLETPRMQALAAGTDKMANILLPHSRTIKYQVYADQFPELELRVRKYDGGESVRPTMKELNVKYRAMYQVPYSDEWTVPAADFYLDMLPLKT